MKKAIFGLVAMFLTAFALYAFTGQSSDQVKDEPAATEYYWYSADGSQNLGYGLEPPLAEECTVPGIGCAKGFEEPPIDPENDSPQATRGQE